ncbi:hypothetical protein NDU88_006401 [Pleurodeles waltl]|uniref:Uncharacterized protein n=1 Tax=Pleurodeles waltl TaxID=8319 RepID=A0AAV7MZE0_PLEWA|nr:hypothetical protein NDU88_006401 [Pleurodeles waltl]
MAWLERTGLCLKLLPIMTNAKEWKPAPTRRWKKIMAKSLLIKGQAKEEHRKTMQEKGITNIAMANNKWRTLAPETESNFSEHNTADTDSKEEQMPKTTLMTAADFG